MTSLGSLSVVGLLRQLAGVERALRCFGPLTLLGVEPSSVLSELTVREELLLAELVRRRDLLCVQLRAQLDALLRPVR